MICKKCHKASCDALETEFRKREVLTGGEFLSDIPEQCGKLAARLNLEFFGTIVGIRL